MKLHQNVCKSSISSSPIGSKSLLQETVTTETLMTLRLSGNPKLQAIFSNDPNADLTIIHGHKRYQLQKAHLRLETDFFDGAKSAQFIVKHPFHAQTFEEILKCIYGSVYSMKKQGDVYHAYYICQTMRLDLLLRQIESAILRDFRKFNYFIVFQIGNLFNNDDLRAACLDYLEEEDPRAYINLLDINQAKCQLIKTKQITTQTLENQPPTSILLLNETCFRNLIQLHNQYKTVNESKQDNFVSYSQVYQLIKLYVECRVSEETDPDLHKEYIRALVLDLIDRRHLTSKEYRQIYHSDLLFPFPAGSFVFESTVMEEPAIQSLNTMVVKSTKAQTLKEGTSKSSKDLSTPQESTTINPSSTLTNLSMAKKTLITQTFDPLLSENYLAKIEVRELREENTSLLAEVQKLRVSLEQTVQHGQTFTQQMGQMQTHFTQLDIRLEEKIGSLQTDLREVKVELQQKKQEVLLRDQTIKRLQDQLKHKEMEASNDSSINDRDFDNIVGMESFNVMEPEDLMNETKSQVVNESRVDRLYNESSVINNEDMALSIITTQSQFMQGEASMSYMESNYNIVSESQMKNYQTNQSLMSLQITQVQYEIHPIIRRMVFDYDPVTLDDPAQLNFIVSHLDLSIFQKLYLKQIYVGYLVMLIPKIEGWLQKLGNAKLLVLMKSWDYDKCFGVYLPLQLNDSEEYQDVKGFLFSVTHGFTVPYVRIRMDEDVLLEIGEDLVIGTNCQEERTCFSQYPAKLSPSKQFTAVHLVGARNFQLDEIEAYAVQVQQSMD